MGRFNTRAWEVTVVGGCLLWSGALAAVSAAMAGETAEPRYLIFQMFTYAPNATGQAQRFDRAELVRWLTDLVQQLGGTRGDGARQQLGFAVGPLALDHTDEELRATIRESFDIALGSGLAVAFHIDDSMFWRRRSDLWVDPENVEWRDWNRTIHSHRIIGWVAGGAPILAPPMCYTSPTLRREIRRIGREVIGAEIVRGIERLQAAGKPHLFAGVITGWETRLDDDSSPPVKIGYCALTDRGYSASLPPAKWDRELVDVVHDWAALWARALRQAGVSKDRIYTHIAVMPAKRYLPDGVRLPDIHAPPSVAFNGSSRPGFSVYPSGLPGEDTDAVLATVGSALQKRGNPRWAMAEGTKVNGPLGSFRLSWDQYLGWMVEHNASLINVYAWQEPADGSSPYGRTTHSAEAIAAYKKFLLGGFGETGYLSEPKAVMLNRIPETAELIFNENGYLYTMDRNGRAVTQVTFGEFRHWDHAAVSYDHRYVAATSTDPEAPQNGVRLWLFDLQEQTEARVLPTFFTAGDGGVDWDENGRLYFGAVPIAGTMPDLYQLSVDRKSLTQLTDTPERGETDVSVLGGRLAYIKSESRLNGGVPEGRLEVWVAKTDGSDATLVWRSERFGRPGFVGPADPELSPDGTQVVFSDENPDVTPVQPFNTAHDLYVINVDGTGKRCLTQPGSISIIPDWRDDLVVYTQVAAGGDYSGMSAVSPTGLDQMPRRVLRGAHYAKWIPPRSTQSGGAARSRP